MQEQHKRDRRKLEKTQTPGIFKRGKSYVVVGRDSRGKQVKRFARTLAEARVAKSELRTDVHRGEYRALSRVTFETYAVEWLDSYTGRSNSGVRPGTLADYRSTIEREAIPFFGRKRLAEIEPRDVKRYVTKLAARTIPGTEQRPARTVSPNTVRLALAPVRALFATALEDGLIRSNPTLGVRIPRPEVIEKDGEQVKALTTDELRALLDALPPQWRLLHEFLAHTGLRIGEHLALQWKHIDFGNRRVLVRRRWYRGDFAPPKSRYGRRDVPLTAGMTRGLWELRKAAGGDQEALVFPSQTGGVLNSSNFSPGSSNRQRRSRRALGRLPHTPPHVRNVAFPQRHERQAGADLARPPLARLHHGDLRSPAAGRLGRRRVFGRSHGFWLPPRRSQKRIAD